MKKATIDIIDASYMEYPADIYTVRWQVFTEEQGIDPAIVMDDRDYNCQHALALEGKAKEPVATGRIDIQQNGKIGRVAVLSSHRGLGLGKAIVYALERQAKRAGLRSVWCHAQKEAVPLYSALGYLIEGGEFMEADVPHYKMQKSL